MEINAAAGAPAGVSVWPEPDANKIAETHTGLVFLVGDRACKVKAGCHRLPGLHFGGQPRTGLRPRGGTQPPAGTPQLPGRRSLHSRRRDARTGHRDAPPSRRPPAGHHGAPWREPLDEPLADIALLLARFHAGAHRGPDVDEQARADAVAARWQENLAELAGYARGRVPGLDPAAVTETARLAEGFIAGRSDFVRPPDRRGPNRRRPCRPLGRRHLLHARGPALLDCLEFDDRLRYVDVADDLAFLAMDLEFLGRPDLAEVFASRYAQFSGDDAPVALRHFYIAYRAGVRAKGRLCQVHQGAPSRHSTPSATSTSH